MILRVSPVPPPWLRRRDQFPGCPKSRVSSPFADSLRFESPQTSVPRLTRICFRGLPRFRICGWVDDVSLAESNLASSVCTADESSYPIGLHTSCAPTLDAFIQSHSGFPPAGEPACVLPTSTASCIVLSGRKYNSNSLLAHQLERSLGLVNLWKQVQKML